MEKAARIPLKSTQMNNRSGYLLGLDFGSTTSSALVAQAKIVANCVTGHMELGDIQVVFRSEVIFTPFDNETIDQNAVISHLNRWLEESGYQHEHFMAGGVIITGLAARQQNAKILTQLIESHLGEVLIATADDPCLESWLSFMGSCAALSRLHASRYFIHLDIGGGTTNPALALNGNVIETGCYFIGARHFRFLPGSYRLEGLTQEAEHILKILAINKRIGEILEESEWRRIVEFYIIALEKMVQGGVYRFLVDSECAFLQQADFEHEVIDQPIVTFSGGVGELIYSYVQGQPMPSTTFFGDLGIELALGIIQSPILSQSLAHFVPENQGRATAYGLALHSTEISGNTIFLPHPDVLPLRHFPIMGQFTLGGDASALEAILVQIAKSHKGGALQLSCLATLQTEKQTQVSQIKALGQMLATQLVRLSFSKETPLVIVTDANIGKSLGLYATHWGQLPINLMVIDEISIRHANFINIGQLREHMVPIAFYGM